MSSKAPREPPALHVRDGKAPREPPAMFGCSDERVRLTAADSHPPIGRVPLLEKHRHGKD